MKSYPAFKVCSLKSLRTLRVHITVVLILIPLFISSVLIIPLVSIIYLYRFCLFKLSSLLNPSLGKMLSTRSALLATDWPYHKPLFNITFKLKFKEAVNFDQVKDLLETRWIHALDKKGELKYPELRQFITKWMGFTFWKPEPDFSLVNHISEIKLKNKQELQDLIEEIVLKPFEENTSPWQGVLVQLPECSKDQTVAILRWHHCMWDGFATLQLFSELSKSAEPKQIREYSNRMEDFDRYKKQYYSSFWKKLLFLVRAPYEIIYANVDSYDPIKSNSWHLPERNLRRVWKTACAKEEIDIKLIKEVKAKFGVSFTTVLTAGITSAVRNLMIKNKQRKVPEFINAGFPLPLPRRSDKLRNFWALTTLKLPVGEEESLKRLHQIEKRLQRLKTSRMPIISILLLPLLGGLFSWMLKLIFSNRYTSMIVSIMPGPSEELRDATGAITAEGMEFYISLAQGNTGFGISALSYNDKITICATVDVGIEEQASLVQDMADDVGKEIRKMLCFTIDDV